MLQYRIGEAAERPGISVATIRYYEKEGLVPLSVRSDNSYRLCSAADVHRLRFIRPCHAMDMSHEEVRSLLSLDLRRKEECDIACEALDAHLQYVQTRLARIAHPGGEPSGAAQPL